MLWTSFVVVLFTWGLGIVTSVTLSGLIHLLPLAALCIALAGTLQMRR
jgi:hypothetical protein